MTHLAVRTTVFVSALALGAAAAVTLAGCSSATVGETVARPSGTATSDSSAGSLGAGFVGSDTPPAPESTVTPAPGSWSGVHAPDHYDVVLLSDRADTEDSAAARTLARAVRSWAAEEHVTVTPVVAADPDDRIAAVGRALDHHADLVVSVGNDMVDPVAAVSPTALRQQFLVLGAEIAEPTSNVTAADWTGGGFRGEGLGPSSHYDPRTFTADRAGRALRAGVAAVLHDLSGIVVWVD